LGHTLIVALISAVQTELHRRRALVVVRRGERRKKRGGPVRSVNARASTEWSKRRTALGETLPERGGGSAEEKGGVHTQ